MRQADQQTSDGQAHADDCGAPRGFMLDCYAPAAPSLTWRMAMAIIYVIVFAPVALSCLQLIEMIRPGAIAALFTSLAGWGQ
jgi:hypothetical protein